MKKAEDMQFEYLEHDDRGLSKYWSAKDVFEKVVCYLNNPEPKNMQAYLDIWHTTATGLLRKIGPLPWVAVRDAAYDELTIYISKIILERDIYSGLQIYDFADTLHIHLGDIEDGAVSTGKGLRYKRTVIMGDGFKIKVGDAKTFRKYRHFAENKTEIADHKQFKKFVRVCELLGVDSWWEITGEGYENRGLADSYFFKSRAKFMNEWETYKVKRNTAKNQAIVWVD